MYGQIKTPFLLRYQTAIQGNLTLIANNVLSVNSTANYNGILGNHDTTTVFVDVDSDTTTFNSSNATLMLPPALVCPEINKVFLYWSAADKEDPSAEPDWSFNKVKLKIPGDSAYRLVTADDVIYQGRSEHFYNDPYTCFKDITDLVPADPNGTYWVGNVKAKQGTLISHGGGNTGTSGGWIIVFVYESTSLPQKSIAIFDGYVHVANEMSPNPLPFTFSGFQTVPTGNVNIDFLMGSLEGDWDLTGDYCQIQKVDGSWLTMSSSLRQTNNFFHSIIGVDGSQFLSRNPASRNTLGFDADKFPIPNAGNTVIGNNQTSATIRMGTNQEIYGLFLIGLAVDVWYPSILTLYTIPAMAGGSGGSVNAGDTVTFSFATQNLGNDGAVGLVQSTLIPPGLDFLTVLSPVPAGVTYAYNVSNRLLQFSIPNDLVEVGDTQFTLQYMSKAIRDCTLLMDSATCHPVCQVISSYHGVFNPAIQTAISSTGLSACGIGNMQPVAFTIIPLPSVPVAANDSVTTPEDTPAGIPVLVNDTDCDTNININSIWVIQDPAHGIYQTNFNTGLVIYTPDMNYNGTDTLRYRICDFDGLCDTAWVYIHVSPVNDPPVVRNEFVTMCMNTTASGNLLANDADSVEQTAMVSSLTPVTGPSHGMIILTPNGDFTYTPSIGFTGSDKVIIRVCDTGFPLPPQCLNDTIFFTVNDIIQSSAGADQHLCMDSTVNLLGNNPWPGTGNWTQVSGPVAATIISQGVSSATASGLIPGIYNFIYTITIGSCISSDTMEVSDEAAPTPASAGQDQFLCMEGSGTTSTYLSGNFPANGLGRWEQLQGPNTALISDTTAPGALVTSLIHGSYTFRWTISNGVCQPSSDSVAIVVSRVAEAHAGPDHLLCANDQFIAGEASATNYISVSWHSSGSGTFNDSTLIQPTYTPSSADIGLGHAALFMTAQSAAPCHAAVDTLMLAFSPVPVVSAGHDGATCEMSPFHVDGAGFQNADSLAWSHNGKGILTGTGTLFPVYSPATGETGAVTITLTVYGQEACIDVQAADDFQLVIYEAVKADAGVDQLIPAGSSAALAGNANSGSGSYSFRWEPAGLFENNASENATTKAITNDTTIYLVVKDLTSGCSNTDSTRLTVFAKPVEDYEGCIKIYNTITPNGDGLNDQWIIDCIENFPANKVTLFDRWGDKINEFENYDNISVVWKGTTLKNESLPDGTYYYIIAIKNGGTYTGWVYMRGVSK
ncbi:MAG: Ig-like domain-containing protein [Bacteroidetes bacterium]|nr:Ig-like domain-containing protein [Bacteroidota bacterium]